MESAKITTQESEAVERAFYEEQSLRGLLGILARQLNAGENAEAADMLKHYAELYRMARMRLQMIQNKLISRYFDPEKVRDTEMRFDFERQEVYPIAKVKTI